MREGVIGGICLLAFLLSLGQAEDLDDTKKSEESDTAALAGTDLLSNNERRNLNEDGTIPIVISNDLNKSELTISTNQSNSQGELKSSVETQNNVRSFEEILAQNGRNSSQSKEASETVAQPLTAVQPNPKVTETQFNSDKELINQAGRSLTPQGQVLLNSNAKTSEDEDKKSEIANNASPYYVGLNVLPPLYASHVAGEAAKQASNESHFSPIFSSNKNHWAPGSYASSFRNSDSHSSTLPAFPNIPQPGVEYTRRELKKDDIQERNVDESQYSETMNSYPYSPPSDKSDSASNESNEVRSGAPYGTSYPPYQTPQLSSAQAYAAAQVQSNIDNLREKNQGSNPYSYGYPPGLNSNSANVASASALAQFSSGAFGAQSSTLVIEDGRSRIIWPNELIFLNKIPGGENVIQCAKENELYHFWSRTFDCMVCICLNVYGLLEPICASCSGCQQPAPPEPPLETISTPTVPWQSPQPLDSYAPIPIPDPYIPLPLPDFGPNTPSASAPSLIVIPVGEVGLVTTPPPVREVPATCNPLPSGQPFTNPLHPCQICICKEFVNTLGKTEFRINCQDNHSCVLPPDVTPIPPLPDVVVPVPLPACEKFPPHVSFPHPTESCKTCKCSLELSAVGLPEQQITCTRDITCAPVTPPLPPIPIPVEPYAGPVPEPSIEPVPENYPNSVPPPNAVTPEEPLPWPPLSTPAPPLIPLLPKRGPLPGPSPHDSCRPYPPNQLFQHPWDDCQVCQCSETRAIGVVNVEISCYTKLSCCIESPDQVISAIAEASSAANDEESQATATAVLQGSLSSTLKPPYFGTYVSGSPQSQGYAGANALAQNLGSYALGGTQNQGYAEANAIAHNSGTFNPGSSQSQIIAEANALAQNSNYGSQNQGYAEANALAQNSGTYIPGGSQNQGYSEANAVAQSSGTYIPGGSQNQGYAEANALAQNSSPYIPGGSQNQGYSEANAVAQNSGTYIPGGSQNQGYAESNALAQNSSPYMPGGSQNQGYSEGNAVAQNSGTYIPGGSQNQGYAEANALVPNSGPYIPGGSQNKAYSEANALALNSGNYIPGVSPSQGYAGANALAQNTLNSPSNQPYGSYQSTNAISNVGNQLAAEATADNTNFGPFTPYNAGIPQNQGYAEANALAQNSLSNPKYPGLYQSANAYGSVVNGGSQTSAEAIAEYNNLPTSFNPYNPVVGQNQAYAEANAVAQNHPAYQVPVPYKPAKGISNMNSAETSDELSVTYKTPSLYSHYNPGISQSQAYADANAQYTRPVSTARPPTLYNPYNSDVTQNKAYAEAMAQYNDMVTNTQKPPIYGPYNPSISQSQALAQANAQYNSLITSTYKPPSLYNPYKSEISQNPVYPQANAVYTITSTPRPASLYGQYNPSISQNQAYAAANALQYPYNTGGSKYKENSAANAIAQSSVNNPGYYGAGSYQSASGSGSVSGGDQSSAVAEAVAQSQDFPPYYQAGSQAATNTISSPQYGYPYQSNYYQNPQLSSYGAKSNVGQNGQYKTSPVKYAGNYDFNGQADSISVLNPQNGYYPYTSGYSQGVAASNLYPSLYPKKSYEITPLYRPGQFGGSSVQSSAQAYAGSVTLQSKSGEGHQEDSNDSK